MTTRARFDIESNGFLETITKVHCLSWHIAVKQEDGSFLRGPAQRAVGHKAIRAALLVLDACDQLVAHNGIGYDLLALWKVLRWKFRPGIEHVDTFVLSCLVHPDIDAEDGSKHSLEAWGKRLGNHKGDYTQWCEANGIIDPWSEYREEMGVYCDQDVDLLGDVDDTLIKDMAGWDWSHSAAMEHQFAKDFAVQAQRGVLVDLPWINRLLRSIDKEMVRIDGIVEPLLPPRPGTKTQLKACRPPKLFFKKDGAPSANALKWFDKVWQQDNGVWWGEWQGRNYKLISDCPMEDDGSERKPLQTMFPATLADQQHIKTWLMDMGWRPTMWSYKKKKDDKGKLRYIRDDKGKLIPTWPKFHDKGVLCENLESINTDFEHVKLVVRWVVIRHRRGLVQSIKDAIRPDGTVSATGMALGTPTSRVTHKVVANIPKADKTVLLGKECRAMFIARPGRVFVGIDASGLELRCLAHYVGTQDLIDTIIKGKKPGDEGYEGIDEIHTKLWKACDPYVRSRSDQKPVTYGWLYGASDSKLGITAGHAENKADKVGGIIRKRLISGIPGLDKLMERIEKSAGKGWIKAIDGRKIEIRAKHATLNTLLQSCGSILVKMAQCYMNAKIRELKLDAWQVISYHDEVQLDCHPDHAQQAGELFIEGLQWAGEQLGIRCPLDGEVKIGKSWADTH